MEQKNGMYIPAGQVALENSLSEEIGATVSGEDPLLYLIDPFIRNSRVTISPPFIRNVTQKKYITNKENLKF